MKVRISAVLVALLLALTPLAALGEDTTYAFDRFSINLPGDYDVFTVDNLDDEHILAQFIDMQSVRATFEANPYLYLDACSLTLNFEISAVVVPIEGMLDLSVLSDEIIEASVFPALIEKYEGMNIVVYETGIERLPAATYLRVKGYVAQEGNEQYIDQFYAMIECGGAAYGVTVKALSQSPLTDEMSALLEEAVATVTFSE